MRSTFLVWLLCLGLSACSSGLFSFLEKPKVVEEPPESRTPVPRDARTRAKAHTELGGLYMENGNWAIAIEELTIAISIDPDYAKAYSARGVALYYIRELALADRDFQRALGFEPNDPEINNNYGWYLCQIGREKESIAYFQRAMRNPLYETPEKAYLNAGACYAKLGELDIAEGLVQQSLNISPDNPQAAFQLAALNYRRGYYEAAKRQLEEVLRKTEANAEVLWLMVRIEHRLGNRSAEARHSSQLRRKFPLSPEAQELLRGKLE